MSELSEEEIIKILKHVIEPADIEHMSFYEIYENYVPLPKLNEAIQGLLDLYQKEKEKNGILQEELNNKIKALDFAMSNPDYISKDKIRNLEIIDINGFEVIDAEDVRELLEERN